MIKVGAAFRPLLLILANSPFHPTFSWFAFSQPRTTFSLSFLLSRIFFLSYSYFFFFSRKKLSLILDRDDLPNDTSIFLQRSRSTKYRSTY